MGNDASIYTVKLNAADAAIDRDSRCIYIHDEAKIYKIKKLKKLTIMLILMRLSLLKSTKNTYFAPKKAMFYKKSADII